MFLSMTALALCAPFLPLELEKKGLSGTYVGIIFSLYAVGQIVISPVISKVIDKVGPSNLLALSMGLMGVTFIGFGFIEISEKRTNVLALALILRLMQGMCCGSSYITCLTIAANEYPENREKIVGLLSVGGSLGLIAGPLAGSTIYNMLGFSDTFFAYGGFQATLALLLKLKIPDREEKQKTAEKTPNEVLLKEDRKSEIACHRHSKLSMNIDNRLSIITDGHITGNIFYDEKTCSNVYKISTRS